MAGTGSIQKRGADAYLLVYSNGYGPDGKRIRKTRTVKAKNMTEAKKLLAAFVTEIELGEYVAPSKTHLRDYVEVWRRDKTKRIAPSTLETYNYVLDARILPALGHMKLEDIGKMHLEDYLEDLEAADLSTAYIQKNYNILNSILKFAVTNETLRKNPLEKVQRPSVDYKAGAVYNSEQLKELFDLLRKEENQQMALMIRVALKTGLRKGELLALQWDDIDFAANTIHVRHSLSYTKSHGYLLKEPKTEKSARHVAPPRKLMDELRKHKLKKSTERMQAAELWEGGKYFFVFSTDLGKPFFPDAPNRWWNRFLARNNFPKIRFHDLRHTAATDLINKNVSLPQISKRLGHSKISTTSDIYGHLTPEADQNIADLLNEDYI